MSLFFKNETPFDFRGAVNEAYAMFPDIAGKIFFLDGRKNTIYHPNPRMTEWAVGMANANAAISSHIVKHGKDRMSVAVRTGGLCYILLYPDNPLDALYGLEMPDNQRHLFTFDHELGHAIAKPGDERAADAYAALRHIQRFGQDTTFIRRIALGRAQAAVSNPDDFQSANHYTVPVLYAVIRAAARQDVTKLSPAETVKLAEKIVQQVNMKPVSKLHADFKKAFAGYSMPGVTPETRVRSLAKTVMDTNDGNVYTSGGLMLQALLKGQLVHRSNDNKPVYLRGPEWDRLRGAFNKHAKDRREAAKRPKKQSLLQKFLGPK